MKLPVILRRNISRVPQVASHGAGQRAFASVYSDVANTSRLIRKSVDEKQVRDAQEDAVRDFAEAANDRDGLAPIELPSRDRKFLWFRYEDEADEAYNQVVKKLRMDRAVEDFDQKAVELKNDEEIGMDAGTVDEALTVFGKEYLSGMLEEEREVMELAFNDRRNDTVQSIALARQEADRKEAADSSIRRITSNKEELATILEKDGLGALESPRVQRLIAEVEDNVPHLVDDPWFTYSEGWGEEQSGELADIIQAAGIAGETLIAAEGAYLEGGKAAADQAIQDLVDQYGDDLPLAVIDRATARADVWVAEIEREREAAELKQHRAFVESQSLNYHDALRDLADGHYTAERALSDFREAKISNQQYTSLYQQIRARDARKTEDDALERAILAGMLPDPESPEAQRAVDNIYQRMISVEGVDPIQSLHDIIKQTNIVPESAVGNIRAAALGGEPAQRTMAYDLLSQIDQLMPARTPKEFGSEIIRDARYYRQWAEYLGPDRALEQIEIVQERRKDPVQQDLFKNALKIARDEIDERTLINAMDKGSGTLLGKPKLPVHAPTAQRMIAIMQDAFATAYTETGDKKAAKDHAVAAVREGFGVSRVSGRPTIMPHPPELYYFAPGAPEDWIAQQFAEDVEEFIDAPSAYRSIGIVPHRNTASEAATTFRPSYAVAGIRDDGVYEAFPGVVWYPDSGRAMAEFQSFLDGIRVDPHDLQKQRVLQTILNHDQLIQSEWLGVDAPPLRPEDQERVDAEKRRRQTETLESLSDIGGP